MFFKGKIVAAVFAQVAYMVLKLAGWKRKTVLANAKYVKILPDYNILLKNLTRHASELLFCFGTFKRLPADFSKYPCRVDGWDFALDEAAVPVLEKMRSGGIFLTAHYANYEAMGPWLCCLGIPLVASYIPVKPNWLNNILERKIRAVNGKSYSVDARTPRDFLRILNDGKLFCLLSDQDSRIPSAIDGTFLDRTANVNPLPDFLLKHRPQTPIYICWIEEKNGVRELHAIEVASSAHVSVVNTQFNKWLEQRIAENPNLWYGFTHRRFYSRSPEIYGK